MINMEIKLNNECYKVHKVYNLFAANDCGKIINIVKKQHLIPKKGRENFYKILIRKYGQTGNKTYNVHDFIYECYFGSIPENKILIHMNKDKSDNCLCNLKLIKLKKNAKYKKHPIYSNYESNKYGLIRNAETKRSLNGYNCNNGYITITLRDNCKKAGKTFYSHRFIYECFYGVISDNEVIIHKDSDKTNNKLNNLHLISKKENYMKYVNKNYKNKRFVKATNIETNDVSYYNSMYAVQKHLLINAGIVKMVCEGLNNCKTGISKKDKHAYKFEYICENDQNIKCK